jgi:methionine-rich copper-binding protein CopC
MVERSRRRATLVALVMLGVALSMGAVQVRAHATPESAIPPIDGTVDVAPPTLEIIFSQEVGDGTLIEVFGPEGKAVHAGPAELDLNDPDRKRVTVPLFGNLAAGVYTVNWTSVSAEDGDADSGSYTFTVTAGGTAGVSASAAASPEASPAASPDASPVAAAGPVSAKEQANLLGEAAQQQATQEASAQDNVDEGDMALALLPGIGAGILIYLFWRVVRPKRGQRAAS